MIFNEATGCGDTLYKRFLIDYIKADFSITPSFACQLPVNLQFTNLSENAVSYSWLLPDSSVSTQQDPVYTVPENTTYFKKYTHYLLEGTPMATLTAVNGNGCSDIVTHEMQISLLTARFMPDTVSGCIPFQVTFSDSSKSSDPIVNWSYLIDGNVLSDTTSADVPYTFTTAGDYPVKLVIQNDQGCVDTSYEVTIHAGTPLKPAFSASNRSQA